MVLIEEPPNTTAYSKVVDLVGHVWLVEHPELRELYACKEALHSFYRVCSGTSPRLSGHERPFSRRRVSMVQTDPEDPKCRVARFLVRSSFE